MNIGVFTDTFKPNTNGVVDVVWRDCKGLAAAGHNVHLFAISNKNATELKEGVKVHKYKGKVFEFYPDIFLRKKSPIKEVKKIVEQEGIEVLHSNVHLTLGKVALKISNQKNIPLITTFHTLLPQFIESYIDGWDPKEAPRVIQWLKEKKFDKGFARYASKFAWWWMKYYNLGDALTVPSHYTRKRMIEKGFSAKRIKVVPNPINLGEKRNVKKQKGLILHVGRLSAEKKVNVFIKSLRHVKNDYEAVITSDGPLRKQLEELVKKEGVNVKFTGFISRKELEDYYDKASIFVSAAEYDTFNNCVAEAIVRGVPVIINQNSGATDFVKHNKNGLIIKSNKPRIFAEKIDELLTNNKLRKKLSKPDKEIRAYTSLDNIIKELEKIYEQTKHIKLRKKLKDYLTFSIASGIINFLISIGSKYEERKS